MRYSIKWLSTLALSAMAFNHAHSAELRTVAEQSGFKQTGRYDETVRLCNAFQQSWPKQARCFEFGRTPEGRTMLALAVSADGMLDAASTRKAARPILLMQGGIHAGEIDGKDAGFLAVRDLLEGRAAKDTLKKITLVFVPIFNIDGHERFGPNHRPNQIGPEAMGWRTTAQNLNLNRDYIKADAPEMRAMLKLLNEWDPIVYADLHVTDGAEFEHDISINVAPTLAGDARIVRAAKAFNDAIVAELSQKNSLPIDFYPSFVVDDDPKSGFSRTISPPRFSHEYWAMRNRIGVLVETHSWKNYKTRVRGTYNSIIAMVAQTAAHGTEWLNAAKESDDLAKRVNGRDIVLAYQNSPQFTTIEFRGYRYTREPSAISGALMTKYNNQEPQIWRIPLYEEVHPALTIAAPRGGYIVPAAWAAVVAEKLTVHDIAFQRIGQAIQTLPVQSFRATNAQLSPASNEGRATLTVQGQWQVETRDVPVGSLYVPMKQARSRLAMSILEPQGPDSLLAWGFFNTAFERKEYMEGYIAEQVAVAMLGKDAKLKAEFEKRVQDDPAFAKSPQARLDFFYRRHPSWDERFNLYPVYRVESDPTAR